MLNRQEFEKSLVEHSVLAYWMDKNADEVETLLGPEISRMVGFDQRNPHHCYDLFNHSLQTVKSLPPDSPIYLRTAAFFHDIGKPNVAKEKQGRLVFYGHAAVSADICRGILKRLRYNNSEQELICFFIKHHDDFISYVLPSEPYDRSNPYLVEINTENINRHLNNVRKESIPLDLMSERELWFNLLDLCCADVKAQVELVYTKGIQVDSREHKLLKLSEIRTILTQLNFEE